MNLPDRPAESQATFPDPLPGIIPFGSVNLLAGASGVGKTCLTAWLCTRFRDALPIFGHQPSPVSEVAYLCADRSWRSSREWFVRAGYPDIHAYSLVDDLDFDPGRLELTRSLIPILRESLDKLAPKPGALVILDPAALFIANLNDYRSCAVALTRMRRIAMERQITLLGLMHAAKQKNDDKSKYQRLQDRILGSAAQHGYGDTQMYLAAPAETGEKFYSFLWQSHLVQPEVFALGRHKESGLFIPWAEAEGDQPPDPDRASFLPPPSGEEGALLSQIPPPPETRGFAELVEASGDAGRTSVYRYLQRLQELGLIVKVGHGRYQRVQPS